MSTIFKRRVINRNLPISGSVNFAIMTGTQRDLYMTAQLKLRAKLLEKSGLSEEEMTAKTPPEQEAIFKKVMLDDPDIMLEFNKQQYKLIAWCVLGDGDKVEWGTPEEVEDAIDYEVATELATASAEINKLTETSQKEIQTAFFDQLKDGSGTRSPAPCADPTSQS